MTARRFPTWLRLLPAASLMFAAGAQADARAELEAAFVKAMAKKAYRMHIEVENKRGPYRSQIDVQLPDRFHMRSDDVEFVIVPQGTWMNAGGQWMRVPVDMSKQVQGYRLDDVKAGMANIKDVQKVGSENVAGCESGIYRYSATSSFAGRTSEDEMDVAICGDSGLPVEMRTRPKKKGEAVTIRYDFEAAVDIRPPG